MSAIVGVQFQGVLRYFGLLLAVFTLSACGGGGSNPSGPTSQQGVFLDSVVEGISYTSGSLSGTTDASGMFSYETGATVTFKIGDIVIGTAPGASIMTPISLVPGATDETDPVVTNIVRFLLTIDDDGDPTNGIQVTAVIQAAAAGMSVDFTSGTFATDTTTTDALAAMTTASATGLRAMVDSTFAQTHFNDTLLRTMAGIYNGTFGGDDSGTWTMLVANDGSITGSGCSTVYGSNFLASGSVTSSGDGAFGVGGSSTFTGSFTLTGNFSGSWKDQASPDTGTFSGSKASAAAGGSCAGGGTGGGGSATLDATFGANGKVIKDLGGDDVGRALAIDSANRLIVAGQRTISGNGDFATVRFNTDGSLDSSFGPAATGIIVTNLGADDRGRSVVIDSAGKLVVGGDSLVTASDFALVRYNSNGTLDASFNGSGLVTTDFNNTGEPAMDIAIDQNGKVVAAGFAHNGTDYDFAVARYNTDGALDTTLNASGLLVTDLGGDDRISAVAIDANGKIVVVGRTGSASDYDIAFVRYNNDGSLDTSFGTGGVVVIDLGTVDDRAREIAFDSSNRVVIAGRTGGAGNRDYMVMRYNTDGSPDSTFGTNGIVVTDVGGDDRGRDIVIDSGGRLIVLGTSNSQGDNDFTILRYNSDGSIDTTFGVNGIASVDFGADDRGIEVALDSNGMIVVAGRSDRGSGNDFAVARLLP